MSVLFKNLPLEPDPGSSRGAGRSSLPLLVTRVRTDDPNDPLALHNLAILANPSHAASYFHESTLYLGQKPTIDQFPSVNTCDPFSVIAMVCSKCADGLPSFVTTGQPVLSPKATAGRPVFTMGSTARTIPG